MRKWDFWGQRIGEANGQYASLLGAMTKKSGLRVSVRLVDGGGWLTTEQLSIYAQEGMVGNER